MKLLTSVIPALAFVLIAPFSFVTDLVQAWQAAQLHDPEFAAAQASYEATMTHRDQSRGMWLPTVTLTAGVGVQDSATKTSGAQFSAPGFTQTNGVAFDTSINNGKAEQYALVARQPVLNRALLSQTRQLDLSADMAEIAWKEAKQQLALRVAERYFDLTIANETLRLLKQQQVAVELAFNQTKDSFKLGSIPVTDTFEAQARVETIKAQIMAAEMDVQIKQSAFADLTGASSQNLALIVLPNNTNSIALPSIEKSLDETTQNNPALLIQETKLSSAKEEAEKHRLYATPTIDVVAQTGYDKVHGNGDFGPAENSANNRMIGIQLTIPLFTGGIRSSKYTESVHLIDKAKSEGELLRQQLLLQTRAAWLGITVGESRVAALIQAYKASMARLDATRLGHSEGDRTTLELLNAENDATSSELAVVQAQIAVAINRLKLAQLNGSLDDSTLQVLNRVLTQQVTK